MIVLKWLLAMLLTSVPFVFHYCIKPKAASSDKWATSIVSCLPECLG